MGEKQLSIKENTRRDLELFGRAARREGMFSEFQPGGVETFEKGVYGFAFARPSRRMQNALGVDREILVVVSTFRSQQPRTIEFAQSRIEYEKGRCDNSVVIVVHGDGQGDASLKEWGRQQGMTVLPVFRDRLENGDANIGSILREELYAHDPFNTTGPVSGDQFFGRGRETIDMARMLQNGQIKAYLGIRKIGKTSLVNEVIREIRTRHDCVTVMIDCSRDDVWPMDATELLATLAKAVDEARDGYMDLPEPAKSVASIGDARALVLSQIRSLDPKRPLVFIFDEVDYISPGSTTNDNWKRDFNVFWRNLRAVYQECGRSERRLSILVSGVSSYWFNVGSIDGKENAALSFIPEEYLRPLEPRATQSMLKRLGQVAGLHFRDDAADAVAEASGNIPFWARMCGSYVHRGVAIDCRPFDVTLEVARPLIERFVDEEGGQIAGTALRHLFGVHPGLEHAAMACYDGRSGEVAASTKAMLLRYGIVNERGQITAAMIRQALKNLCEAPPVDSERAKVFEESRASRQDGGGPAGLTMEEWADQLTELNKRRNLLERRLREMLLNFVRYDWAQNRNRGAVKDRVACVLPGKERSGVASLTAEETVEKFTWKQLTELIAKKEWKLFESLFGDKEEFEKRCSTVNTRPDAHAKKEEPIDIGYYRQSLKYLEDRIKKVQ